MQFFFNSKRAHYTCIGVSAVVIFAVGMLRLETIPPLWQDEGWTLCAARTWTETGSYACMQMGELTPPTRSANFTVVAPIVLSFKLFGVGIYQARIVGVTFAVAALLLLFALARRLYGLPVALCTMVLLLLLPVKWGLHPLFIGRQVLAETPMLFFLVGGFCCFALIERIPMASLALAILSWGVAWTTKLQVAPFLVAAFLIPIVVVAVRREWRMVRLLAAGLAGSFLVSQVMVLLKNDLLSPSLPPTGVTPGLVQAAAMVLVPSVRLSTVIFAISFGLPTLIGLSYALWRWVRASKTTGQLSANSVLELMLVTLAGSWFLWYVLLSIGWERYAYPPVFLGTPFLALFLRDATHGFKVREAITRAVSFLVRRQRDRDGLLALDAILLGVLMVFLTSVAAFKFHKSPEDDSVIEVATYLNTFAAASAVVETLDSELIFLLQRTYHYPPAQVDLVIIRHTWLGDETPFQYDPLEYSPDYLVVGRDGDWSGLYKDVINDGSFLLEATIGKYKVYRRTSL